MSVASGPHLTYCTNVHPGATWDEVRDNLDGPIRDVRRRVAPGASFGLGMWWSRAVVDELARGAQAWEELRDFLAREDCYVATLNGFPYGAFHGTPVKDRVHAPDWTTRERVEYTRQLFTVLERLVPEGGESGVSTSPLSYRRWHDAARAVDVREVAVRHLVEIAVFLHELRERTGKRLHLDLEPEPDGMLENSEQTVSLFRDHLLTFGRGELARRTGMSPAQAEQCIRDHLCVCFDVCHFSVVHERPREALQRLLDEGIRIGKVHLSAALRWTFDGVDDDALKREVEALDSDAFIAVEEPRAIRARTYAAGAALPKLDALDEALRHARSLPFDELMNLLSGVRLGLTLKLLRTPRVETLNRIMISAQAAHLEQAAGRTLDEADASTFRARRVREALEADEEASERESEGSDPGPDQDSADA